MTGDDRFLADLDLFPHHRDSIQRMFDHLSAEPDLIAVVLGGSVAKGKARQDSDIDAVVVVGEAAYADRLARNATADCVFGKCTYKNGYFDLKFFPVTYLVAAAERGSEPTRNSFQGSRLLQSRDPRVDQALLERIAAYPEAEVERKIISFFSAFSYATGFFWSEAKKRDLVYLRSRCAADAVYYGLRLILVHNRRLFPCHKWLFDAVASCDVRPDRVLDLAAALLGKPDDVTMKPFAQAIEGLHDWGPIQRDAYQRLSTVQRDQEQWWWNGRPNLLEW